MNQPIFEDPFTEAHRPKPKREFPIEPEPTYETRKLTPDDKPKTVKKLEFFHVPGEILRMKMGQKIECECGRNKVDRVGDEYIINGNMYHRKDSGSEWLICPSCNDRIKIHPITTWIDGATPKGHE